MDIHWKSGEYEGHAESLKNSVKSLRKDAPQQHPRSPLLPSRRVISGHVPIRNHGKNGGAKGKFLHALFWGHNGSLMVAIVRGQANVSVRRDPQGQFKKEVSVDRSLAADRRLRAKSKSQGDRGHIN
jgi:hypothetical protein